MLPSLRDSVLSCVIGVGLGLLMLSVLGRWDATTGVLIIVLAAPVLTLLIVSAIKTPNLKRAATDNDEDSEDARAELQATTKLPPKVESAIEGILGARGSATVVVARDDAKSHASSDLQVKFNASHPNGPSVLHDQEQKLQYLYAALRQLPGVMIYQRTKDSTFVSGSARTLVGYSVDELDTMPSNLAGLINPDDAKADNEAYSDWVDSGRQGVLIRRSRFRHKNGQWVWLEDRMTEERDERGDLIFRAGVTVNVSAEVAAKAEAFLAKQRTALALSATGFGVWEQDIVSDDLIQTDECLAMLGLTRSAATSSLDCLRTLVHPDDLLEVGDAYSAMLAGKSDGYESVMRMLHADGKYRHIQNLARVTERRPSGEALRVIGIVRDVSEQVARDERARAAEKGFLESQHLESLGMLASGIAHDFNNYLGAIVGHASLALKVCAHTHRAFTHLENVIAGAERANDLTRQLLAYAGKAAPSVEAVDVGEIIASISTLIRVSIPRKTIIETKLAKDLAVVSGDRGQLQQVVLNVIKNASDAIGSNDGKIAITASNQEATSEERQAWRIQSDSPNPHFLHIAIRDNGAGMDQETRKRLFEPYYTTKPSGHGLGLAALVGIIRAHSGGIDIESQLGVGTTFHIYLPVSERKLAPNAEGNTISHEVSQLAVLAVDDDAMIRDFVYDLLTSQGHQVTLAKDGLEALACASDGAAHFDVVLMDLTMPRMGGVEAANQIHQTRPKLPIILTSGFREADAVGDISDQPNLSFLQKPYFPDDLLAKIESAISRAKA